MSLSPKDFLEASLMKARRELSLAFDAASAQEFRIYVCNGSKGTINLKERLMENIDHGISYIIDVREKECTDAGSYASQTGFEDGVFETAFKRKLAKQLGYDSFKEIPRKK